METPGEFFRNIGEHIFVVWGNGFIYGKEKEWYDRYTGVGVISDFVVRYYNIYDDKVSGESAIHYCREKGMTWKDPGDCRRVKWSFVWRYKKSFNEIKSKNYAYGSQGKRRKYEKDSHIWELIEEIEKGEPEKEKLQKMQSQMIRYISFLLKYDWERTKKK